MGEPEGNVNAKQLHILQHSLGLTSLGKGKEYRNHFVTGVGSDDFGACCELEAAGYMRDYGAQATMRGDHLFAVTDVGKEVVRVESPQPPKLSRSQARYRQWLNSGARDAYGMSFGEWLKRKPATELQHS